MDSVTINVNKEAVSLGFLQHSLFHIFESAEEIEQFRESVKGRCSASLDRILKSVQHEKTAAEIESVVVAEEPIPIEGIKKILDSFFKTPRAPQSETTEIIPMIFGAIWLAHAPTGHLSAFPKIWLWLILESPEKDSPVIQAAPISMECALAAKVDLVFNPNQKHTKISAQTWLQCPISRELLYSGVGYLVDEELAALKHSLLKNLGRPHDADFLRRYSGSNDSEAARLYQEFCLLLIEPYRNEALKLMSR